MVVEGYMDVIALAQAGIDYAVAPLGTALTEEQISHLWQMADEPILSFDGDNAGQRAAGRAVERALPMLKPGKSLRFMMMPEGDDPDSLVQREGRGAIETLIDQAQPLANILWTNLTTGVAIDTPERRAGLERKIFGTLKDMQDENVRTLYQREYKDRVYQLFRRPRDTFQARRPGAGKGGFGGKPRIEPATGLLGKTRLGRGNNSLPVTDTVEKLIVLTVVNHPEILVKYEEEVGSLEFSVSGLDVICNALVESAAAGKALDREAIHTHLEQSGHMDHVRRIASDKALKGDWFAWPEAALSDALTGFEHLMSRYQHITAAKTAYRQAEAEYAAEMTEENHTRFVAAQAAFRALEEKEADKDGYRLESGRFSFN
jgi:DNA primase